MAELPHVTKQAGKTEPRVLLHFRQGLLLDHSGMQGVSSRITFESSALQKQAKTFLWFVGMGIVANAISMVLPPCAVSSTCTWVNQLLTLVHD